MDKALLTGVQKLLNAKVYPPTHKYSIADLTPHGALKERVRYLLELCPNFFRAHRFLDVGASKGFFSLTAAQQSKEVVAIDPDAESLAIWEPVCPSNVNQVVSTFGQLSVDVDGTYDMIWMGNGHHYAAREDAFE
ncbi:hypothetical protein LCGC14_2372450, partial [marine sediment metagenome]